MEPIDPDTIIGPITEVQEPLQEISYDDAKSSVTKQGTKLIKGWNYDQGNEPTKDLEGMLRAFRGKILHFTPRDIEDGQKAQASLWILRQIKKSLQRREDFVNPTASIFGQPQDRSYGTLRNDLEKFFQHNTHMKPKGLDDVISMGALHKVVKDAKPRIEAASAKELSKNAEEGKDPLRNDEEWEVTIINNHGAACELGADTEWCTAHKDPRWFNTYWREDDPLFYIKSKSTGEEWQFHYGSNQFMDIDDKNVDREKWEELHDILKGALEEKGYEEKYPKVWDYEHKDWEEEVSRVLDEQREHIDHRELTIDATVDGGYDIDEGGLYVTPSFRVEFLFDRPADKEFADELDILGYEEIDESFTNESGGLTAGDNSENIQDDAHEDNIDIRTGNTTVQVIITGFKSLSSYDEGDENEVIDATDRFLQDVRHTVDDNYKDIKDKIRGILIKHEMLEGTKYDKLVDDQDAHDGFENQFEGLGVSIFPEDRTIRFQISFLKPDNAKDVPYGFLASELASNKDFMFRIGMKALQRLVGGGAIQQGLPGTDTPAEESAPQAVEGLIFAMQNHQYLNKFEPASEYILATLDMTLSTLTAWNDLFVAGMKVVSQNKKAAQASLTMAVQKYIEKYPDKFPRENQERGPGGFYGTGDGDLTEIVADEVMKVMNEAFVLENCPPGAKFNTETGKPCGNPKSEEEVRKEVDEFMSSKLSKEDWSLKAINKALKKSIMAYIKDDKEEEKKWEAEADRLQDLYISQTMKKFELKSKRAQLIKRFGGNPTKREIESAKRNGDHFATLKAQEEKHRKELDDMEASHKKKMAAMEPNLQKSPHLAPDKSKNGGVDIFSQDFNLERDFDKLSSQQFAHLLIVGIQKSEKGDSSALKKLGAAKSKSQDKKHAAEMEKIVAKYGPKNEASYFDPKDEEDLNEIEPYQKKARKWQKRALKLNIKGGNKYLTKGMKIASTKLGKSAPPGG